MIRSLTGLLAGASLLCALAAVAPVEASPPGPYYQAKLTAALDQPRKQVLDGVVWTCAGDSCAGSRGGSRPVIVCGKLAHHVGAVASFSVAGEALGADDLAACNK